MRKPVCEEGEVQCCGIKQYIQTEKLQQIIIKNNKEKTCTLIDVAIPADRNVVQKEAEKKLKYKNLMRIGPCIILIFE